MSRLCLAVLVTCLLVGACGAGGSSPEGTFKAAKKAIAAKDWGVLFDLMSPEMMEQIKQPYEVCRQSPEAAQVMGLDAEKVGTMTLRDFFVEVFGKKIEAEAGKVEQFAAAEIVSSEVKGDRGVVRYTLGDKEEEMTLAQTPGGWRIVDLD